MPPQGGSADRCFPAVRRGSGVNGTGRDGETYVRSLAGARDGNFHCCCCFFSLLSFLSPPFFAALDRCCCCGEKKATERTGLGVRDSDQQERGKRCICYFFNRFLLLFGTLRQEQRDGWQTTLQKQRNSPLRRYCWGALVCQLRRPAAHGQHQIDTRREDCTRGRRVGRKGAEDNSTGEKCRTTRHYLLVTNKAQNVPPKKKQLLLLLLSFISFHFHSFFPQTRKKETQPTPSFHHTFLPSHLPSRHEREKHTQDIDFS